MPSRDVLVTERAGIARSVAVGPHQITADEPVPIGGNAGPNPFEFVLTGLGTCTSRGCSTGQDDPNLTPAGESEAARGHRTG
ncbi:OsmC family protein [Streptomyces sp. Tue6028]|uniref:OsmC family protein n=1 Tax=Streptomyces sp. Tue6028 TaxID=2036037 RepID=UPI003D761EDF